MLPSRSARPLALLLVALAVAQAGCGDDREPQAEAAPPPAAATTPPLTTAPPAITAPPQATAATPAQPDAGAPPTQAADAPAPDPPASTAPSGVEPPAAPGSDQATPTPAPDLDAPASVTEDPAIPTGQLTVHVTRPTALRTRPGGPVVTTLPVRTEFDSPQVLPVLDQRGDWLAVLSTELPNGKVGWIPAGASLQAHTSDYRVEASLGRREVVVRRGDRVVSRFPVAIGAPGSPTPAGRYAVTDKLLTGDAGSPYGCCILALSGHQTQTPQGWGGGDRLAIHATNLPETIGSAASLGCLRAPTEAARRLVETVPLGTIVTIRA